MEKQTDSELRLRPGIAGRSLARLALPALELAVRRRFHIVVRGRSHVPPAGPVLITVNHRRDTDGPLLGSVLRRSARPGLPRFVAREDLFHRGFLQEYAGEAGLLQALLAPVNVGPVLWALGCRPMRRIPERSIGAVLDDVLRQLGNRPLHDVLRGTCLRQFAPAAASSETMRVRDALARGPRSLLRQRGGFYRLTRSCFRELKDYHRRIIDAQLDHLAALLEDNAALVLAPEGRISDAGAFHRPRAALHALINRPSRTPPVLPTAITYDFLTRGRGSVFVNFGEPLAGLRGLDRRRTDQRISEAIRARATVTASQLVSRFLHGRRSANEDFTLTDLVRSVAEEATRCNSAGVHTDPRLLRRQSCQRRVTDCLSCCVAAGVVRQAASGHYATALRPDAPPRWFHPHGAIEYLVNEFRALSAPAARADGRP